MARIRTSKGPAQSTVVVNGIPWRLRKALVLKTLQQAAEGERLSLSRTIRQILTDWYLVEGVELMGEKEKREAAEKHSETDEPAVVHAD